VAGARSDPDSGGRGRLVAGLALVIVAVPLVAR
jgi:hypothetical protein